jgi:hypothetical protein
MIEGSHPQVTDSLGDSVDRISAGLCELWRSLGLVHRTLRGTYGFDTTQIRRRYDGDMTEVWLYQLAPIGLFSPF